MTYVIVGNGPAGINAIESIRKFDPDGKIVLVSKEATLPYSRIMTPEYMVGEVKEEELYYRDKNFYSDYKVALMLGHAVTGIIPEKKTAVLDDKLEVGYDSLLIATGSSPVFPGFVKPGMNGVFSLWNKSDAEKIGYCLENVSKAAVIGGGLVGLQAAKALASRGIKVTIIEKQNRLMALQLDEKAARMLLEAAAGAAITVLLDTEVSCFEEENGSIRYVHTDKQKIETDMAIVSVGVRPNLSMVEDCGLVKRQGLLVDEYMRTNLPDIYAAGDAAEALSFQDGGNSLRALWLCAVEQGKIAGANMAGCAEKYKGSIAMNSIELFGLPLVSAGQLQGEGIEGKIIGPSAGREYKKLLFRGDRLAGLILAGDIQHAGILYNKLGEKLNEGYMGSFSHIDPELIAAP